MRTCNSGKATLIEVPGSGSGRVPAQPPARPHSGWGLAPTGLTSPIAPNARIAAERAPAGRPATGKLPETGRLQGM